MRLGYNGLRPATARPAGGRQRSSSTRRSQKEGEGRRLLLEVVRVLPTGPTATPLPQCSRREGVIYQGQIQVRARPQRRDSQICDVLSHAEAERVPALARFVLVDI